MTAKSPSPQPKPKLGELSSDQKNILISKALGIQPKCHWRLFDAAEPRTGVFFQTEQDAAESLSRHKAHPYWAGKDLQIAHVEDWENRGYLTELNAIRDAWEYRNDRWVYLLSALSAVCNVGPIADPERRMYLLVQATAKDRSDAFLLALNLATL